MKTGLATGQKAVTEFLVTPEMFARFKGDTVHELLSTSQLVHEMEWAARQTILSYLEPHEEGMGSQVEVHHAMLTPPGVVVKVTATITSIHGNKIECEIEAEHFRGKVAKGKVVQAIVERTWLENKIKEIELVLDIKHQPGADSSIDRSINT